MIAPRIDARPAEHGGRLALESPADVCDFSVCLNAYGPASVVRDAIGRAAIDEYPDPDARLARAVASTAWGCPLQEIALGAGAAELIDAVCRAFLSPGDGVRIERPAFGEYERAARLCGAVQGLPVPRLTFICSPSNPEGKAKPLGELRLIADECAERDSLLVLDQAYDAFGDQPLGTPALRDHPAVLHLRSLTKEHALAGLRVAYAVGPAAVIAAVNGVRVPWSTSALTQAAAIATFMPEAQAHAAATITLLRSEAARIRDGCRQLGYEVSESVTHFCLVGVADASAARRLMLDDARLLVRDCSSFGLHGRIRVAARTPADNNRLLDAFERLAPRLLAGGHVRKPPA